MAKKADLLQEAKDLGLKLNEKNTITEITAAIETTKADTAKEKLKKASEAGEPEIKAVAEQTNQEVTGDNDGNNQEANQNTDSTDSEESEKVVTAKAGKRSAKALAEAEEKAAKEARKSDDSEDSSEASKPKVVQNTRTKLERSGKKYRKAAEQVERSKEYGLKEAIELATKTATTSFDSTLELHIRLGVDPRQADQNIRETIQLPAGTGKSVKVAVFGEADDVVEAKKAGADIAGADEFLQQLDKGVIDFDVLIATPSVMAKLGKYARVLGPKGLMPNPKSGTVTKDVTKAVEQAKAGKVEFRVDETGIVHLGAGKVSFGTDKLFENVQAVFASLKAAKPASIKGNYVRTIYITTTMGPSIKVLPSEL
jgi:large subunit ribosomal protein L1